MTETINEKLICIHKTQKNAFGETFFAKDAWRLIHGFVWPKLMDGS